MARQRQRAEMDYDTKVKAALQRAAAMYQRRRQQQQQQQQEQLQEQPWEVQQEEGEEDIEHLLRLAKEEVRSRISEHQQPEPQPQRLGKPEVRSRVRSHLQTLDPEAADINDARIDEVFERFDLDGSGGISEEECEGLVRHLLSNTRLSF